MDTAYCVGNLWLEYGDICRQATDRVRIGNFLAGNRFLQQIPVYLLETLQFGPYIHASTLNASTDLHGRLGNRHGHLYVDMAQGIRAQHAAYRLIGQTPPDLCAELIARYAQCTPWILKFEEVQRQLDKVQECFAAIRAVYAEDGLPERFGLERYIIRGEDAHFCMGCDPQLFIERPYDAKILVCVHNADVPKWSGIHTKDISPLAFRSWED